MLHETACIVAALYTIASLCLRHCCLGVVSLIVANMSLGAVLAFLLSVLDTAVSYVIPAYFSCKSLSNHNGVETWLTYFLVLGLLRVFEWIFGLLLRYLFFFPLLKLAFVIWLQLPQTKVRARNHSDGRDNVPPPVATCSTAHNVHVVLQGAQVVYAQLIAPLFKAHSPKIDKFIDASHARVHQQMKELVRLLLPTAQLFVYLVSEVQMATTSGKDR